MRFTVDPAPGVVSDDTTFAVGQAAFVDADKTRFWRKRPQTIGGWEALSGTALGGVCRTIHTWSDNSGQLNAAFGTNDTLEVSVGGGLYPITPTLAFPARTLGASPLAVVISTATVTVTHANHGLTTGNSIIVSGAAAVGGITPNGTFAVTVTGLGTYTYTFTSNATSTATGGGSAVVITPQVAFSGGLVDGTGGSGYGTGAYSTGDYSEPSTGDFFAMTWSLASWGQSLMANPRDDTIYWWQNSTSTRAAPLAGAPRRVTYTLVTASRQVMAFGCNEEASPYAFNPLCIRFSDIEDPNDWTTTTTNNAGEVILEGGGRIVGARLIGDGVFVWTDNALYLGEFIGDPGQTWRFERVGDHCGLIGPNAAVISGQTAVWMGADGQFRSCVLGGAPEIVVSPLQADVTDNLPASQNDKIVAATVSEFGEIWFLYPDGRDGLEVSRYVSVSTVDGSWSRGTLARTAFTDAGPAPSPIGTDVDGNIYWHERGHSADGGSFSWHYETGDLYLDEGGRALRIKTCWPDFQDQLGPVSLTITSKMFPQGDETVHGPYAMGVSQDRVYMRVTAKIVRIKVSGAVAPTYARGGKLTFDAEVAGRR